MYTINEFTSEWKRFHHQSMNVDSDVAFYHNVYFRLLQFVKQDTDKLNEHAIFPLLLYIENTNAIGLDDVYEYMYRSVGDVVLRWCNGLKMSAATASRVRDFVSEVVAEAHCSALRQWMTESILSNNFRHFRELLTYFAHNDQVIRQILPDLCYRKAMFMRLTKNRRAASKMLWSDIAFNWRDKYGNSLSETIARQFRLLPSSISGQESILVKTAAEILDTVRTERLDTYTVDEFLDAHTLTLSHRDGRIFRDVIFPTSISEDAQHHCLVAQFVTYMDKTYINGPAVWLNDEARSVWNGETIWSNIIKKEQDATRRTYFTTTFGKRINLFDDLYTVPKDPDEATYSDMGIHFDEPNVFDFIEWLKPSDAVGSMAGQQA